METSSPSKKTRCASHSGSWYSSSKLDLTKQIQTFFLNSKNFLEEKNKSENNNTEKNKLLLKAIIVPHAGYRFSGPTAGWGFIAINKTLYKRIVIMGPSHHAYFEGCGLSKFSEIKTPLGNLKVDLKATESLCANKLFQLINEDIDEDEHSLEMQFPFIKYVFGDEDVEVLPIMIGDIDEQMQEKIAETLIEFYKDKQTLFVVSSDFCHWGKRFRYTFYDKSEGRIFESIENLDKMGMDAIETLSPKAFSDYLSKYRNTICGRKPISVLLSIVEKFGKENNLSFVNEQEREKDCFIKFVQYNQSSKVIEENDSSVSYAAGLNFVDEKYLI